MSLVGHGNSMDYSSVVPLEEFSTEDNQLLMSVLSSTPVSEQYNIAYPQSSSASFSMWDMGGFNNNNNMLASSQSSFSFAPSPMGPSSNNNSPLMYHSINNSNNNLINNLPLSNSSSNLINSPGPNNNAGISPLNSIQQQQQQQQQQYSQVSPHQIQQQQQHLPQPIVPSLPIPSQQQQQQQHYASSNYIQQHQHNPFSVKHASTGAGPSLPIKSDPSQNSPHLYDHQQQLPLPVYNQNLYSQQNPAALQQLNNQRILAAQQQFSQATSGGGGSLPTKSVGGNLSPPSQQLPASQLPTSPIPISSIQQVPYTGGHFLRSAAHQQQQQQQQHQSAGDAFDSHSPPSPSGSSSESPPNSLGAPHSSHGGGNGGSHHGGATDASSIDYDDDEMSGPRNRRRESQNRASRNYRQRKKAYIKEMEAKLDALTLENEVLRSENQKNKRMLNQYQTTDKPAPLIRSYSSELQDEDIEIEKLVLKMNERTNSKDASEEELKELLATFHERMTRRQQLLNKEAIQLINPKLQERLVRLEGIPAQQVDEQMGQWLDQVAQFVSPEQIQKLAQLKQKHFEARSSIWEERAAINADIKTFYQEKLASERMNTPGRLDQGAVMTLTGKLEALKKNLIREDELNQGSVGEFSTILTPFQEAMITVKHYSHYKEKLSAIQMLTNVWNVLTN